MTVPEWCEKYEQQAFAALVVMMQERQRAMNKAKGL